MEFKIAICTYQRPLLINSRTLFFLKLNYIDPANVYLFVGGETEKDYEEYDYLRSEYPNLIRVEKGLHNARNAVRQFFAEGESILFLDDDLKGIRHINKLRYDFIETCNQAFALCKEHDVIGFSFYPTFNIGWMKPNIQIGLSLMYGCAFGCLNTREFKNTLSFKEDYDFSAWCYLQKGGVLRINYLAPIQDLRNTPGGLTDVRTIIREEEECEILLKKYPDLLRKKYRDRWPELFFTRVRSTEVYKLNIESDK